VWFLSLDAANKFAVWGARRFFHLPYFNAVMSLDQTGKTIRYSSSRRDSRGAPAELRVAWTIGEKLPPSSSDSLESFLTERYCLDTEDNGKLYRSRIHHPPWRLRSATLDSYTSTLVESHGLPTLPGDPLLHYCEALSVGIWPLRRV
jgi:uncharacterized protein YqjF (DUF2071 family)